MNLELTETQHQIRNTLRELIEKEVPFARVRELEQSGQADEHASQYPRRSPPHHAHLGIRLWVVAQLDAPTAHGPERTIARG